MLESEELVIENNRNDIPSSASSRYSWNIIVKKGRPPEETFKDDFVEFHFSHHFHVYVDFILFHEVVLA